MNIGDLIIGINGVSTSEYISTNGYEPEGNDPVQITDIKNEITYFDGGFIYPEELENFKVI